MDAKDSELNNPLDPALVQRANDSSVAFKFGDSIVEKYKRNLIEIEKMRHLDDINKALAFKEIRSLRTEELSSQGRAIGANVYGPAVVDSKRDGDSFDAAISKRLAADRFMESLRSKEEKHVISERKVDLAASLKKAAEQGQSEITVNNKTFYKHGKLWTTKKPKLRKTGGRSR
jgi:hypothetical protein